MNPLARSLLRRRLSPQLLKSKEILRHLSSSGSQSFVVQSPYGQQAFPSANIVEFVWSKVDKWPDRVAIECGKSGMRYKYSELRKASRDFGSGILAELTPGSTVAIIMPNCPEFPLVTLGCMEAGFTVSPMNPTYGPAEIKHQVTDSGSKIVFAHPSKVAEVKAACPNIPVLAIGEGSPALDQVIARGKGKDLPATLDPSSVAILPYSSGTTGLPKGVRLTHSNIVSNVLQVDHPQTRMAHETTKDHQEINPCVLPFFHIYGFTIGMILYLFNGSKIVAIPKFEPQFFIDVINKHKPTLIHLVPPLIQFLAAHPQVTQETLASIRIASNGAAPMSEAVAEKFISKSKAILISGYGLTESSPAITCCLNSQSDASSVGHVMMSSELKIVDTNTGEIQDPTVEGEVCCRGPQIMEGYHNNEEATKSTIKDGWLHTGDIGYIGKDNKLYLVDRLKELIKVKGFQVAPVELEQVFQTHPMVADVGVIGVPDDRSGETPVAFVVPRPNSQVTDKELINYLATKVSSPHKRVTKVIFVEAIPRNASGKILRRLLKQMVK